LLGRVKVGDKKYWVIIVDDAVLTTVRSIHFQDIFCVLGEEEEGFLIILEKENKSVICHMISDQLQLVLRVRWSDPRSNILTFFVIDSRNFIRVTSISVLIIALEIYIIVIVVISHRHPVLIQVTVNPLFSQFMWFYKLLLILIFFFLFLLCIQLVVNIFGLEAFVVVGHYLFEAAGDSCV
jgi:hypothetical protein